MLRRSRSSPRTPIILEVNPSSPVKTVPEFIAYAKANPDAINMGSAGTGTPQHISGELFRMMTGANMTHVPYRGEAPAIADLMGGQVQAMFGTLPGSIEYIRAGKLLALGVSMPAPLDALPDVPTIAQSVPGYEANGWIGLGAPKETPAAVVDRLNAEINAGLADPKLKARLADLGAIIGGGSPADFLRIHRGRDGDPGEGRQVREHQGGVVMRLPRRRFLQLAGAAALPAVARIARAQTYPARPVRIVVGFAAGG